MVKRCAHGGCKSDTRYPERLAGGVEFFPFPKPKTQQERCLQWITQCGRPHSQLNVTKINKHTYVCSKHFVNGKPTAEYPNPVLAVTLLVPKQTSCRKPPKKRCKLSLQDACGSTSSTDDAEETQQQCILDSGKPSVYRHDPDYVPSIFPSSEQEPSPKKKKRWVFGLGKKRRKANVKQERMPPSEDDPPLEHQSSVFMEETQTSQSPSVPKEGGTLITGSETEHETNNAVKSQISSGPNEPSPSFAAPAEVLKQGTPTVHLKSVFAPTSGFNCDLCNEVFATASQLVLHRRLHEEGAKRISCKICGNLFASQAEFTRHQHVEKPSFRCNMCDGSFTTSQYLKRHKLLHVKDGRKCRKCGVIFCRLHRHVLFKPLPESERDSLVEPEPNHPTDSRDIAQSPGTTTPLQTAAARTAFPAPPAPEPFPQTLNPLPPVSHRRFMSGAPTPVLKKQSSMPYTHVPVPKYSRDDFPATVARDHYPPTLMVFSPQYLTSAFLEVNRNHKYILSKPTEEKIETNAVKEEPCERPLIPPRVQNIEFEEDTIAYDLEIVL